MNWKKLIGQSLRVAQDEEKRREKETEEPIMLAVTKFIRYCYRNMSLICKDRFLVFL